jgi:hypothetical protein
MSCLRRILIVLSLALLSMQGAFAHEYAVLVIHDAGKTGISSGPGEIGAARTLSSMPSHCTDMNDITSHTLHGRERCPCCTTACGTHCGALLAAFRFEPAQPGSMRPQPRREFRRDGVTYAPAVRPPIS